MYQLKNKKMPFKGDSIYEVSKNILNSEVNDYPAGTTTEFKAYIKWMLNKDPRLRPTMEQVMFHPKIRANFISYNDSYNAYTDIPMDFIKQFIKDLKDDAKIEQMKPSIPTSEENLTKINKGLLEEFDEIPLLDHLERLDFDTGRESDSILPVIPISPQLERLTSESEEYQKEERDLEIFDPLKVEQFINEVKSTNNWLRVRYKNFVKIIG